MVESFVPMRCKKAVEGKELADIGYTFGGVKKILQKPEKVAAGSYAADILTCAQAVKKYFLPYLEGPSNTIQKRRSGTKQISDFGICCQSHMQKEKR